MSSQIQVRISNVTSYIVEIPTNGSVYDIKKEIASRANLQIDGFDLIFCGKLLRHDTSVEELSLGQSSVLHVYSGRSPATAAVSVWQHEDRPRHIYQYYVYCNECNDLLPGKLRVGCGTCHEGAIILDREPDNWDDVLLRDRLEGHCAACDAKHFAQFYFKCCGHDGNDVAIPLRHIRPNTRHRECIVCTGESSPVLVYPCLDKHVICVDCFKQYARVSLDNRTFVQDPDVGYSLACPAGCEDSLIKDVHHFHLMGREQYERYKDFGAEECLLQAGGIICPQPGCGEGLVVDTEARTITCQSCHFEFCRRCRMAVHQGDCLNQVASSSQLPEVDSNRASRSRWDSQSMDTIQLTTKPCPHCGTRTERNGGCMHISCTRCKKDWCWLCEKEWDNTCMGEHWFG